MTKSIFDNQSNEQLADELGDIEREAKELARRAKLIKDEIKARKVKAAQGSKFALTVTESIRQSLDSKAVKEAMGQSWFDDHSRLSEVVTIKTISLAA